MKNVYFLICCSLFVLSGYSQKVTVTSKFDDFTKTTVQNTSEVKAGKRTHAHITIRTDATDTNTYVNFKITPTWLYVVVLKDQATVSVLCESGNVYTYPQPGLQTFYPTDYLTVFLNLSPSAAEQFKHEKLKMLRVETSNDGNMDIELTADAVSALFNALVKN